MSNLVRRFSRQIQSILSSQAREVRAFITPNFIRSGKTLNLSHWNSAMSAAIKPILLEEYRTGMTVSAMALQRQGIPIDIRGLRQRLHDKVNEDVDRLVREMNRTSTEDINNRIREMRTLMDKGEVGPINASRKLGWDIFNTVANAPRSIRIADNELSRSLEAGKLLAADSTNGRVKSHQWECEPNACKICKSLNGKRVKIGTPFYVDPKGGAYAQWIQPPGHVNCLLPKTTIGFISDPVFAMKANYRGTCFRITFINGENFSCTPNHMLLTSLGFLRAKDFMEGDNVIYSSLSERVLMGNPNDYWGPAFIEEIFDSFWISSGMTSSSVPHTPEYLHGDARFCKGDIDIVGTDCFLGNEDNSFRNHVDKSFFQNITFPFGFNGFGFFTDSFYRNWLTSFGIMSGSRDFQASLLAHYLGRVCESHGKPRFFKIPDFQSSIAENSINIASRYSQSFGDSENGFSCVVELDDFVDVYPSKFSSIFNFNSNGRESSFDYGSVFMSDRIPIQTHEIIEGFSSQVSSLQIVRIERFHYDGPVYDVETQSSLYYINNGITSSNCHCKTIPLVGKWK